MHTLKEKLNNKFVLVLIVLIGILLLPVFEVLIKIIFSYGNLVGTYARYILEGKICLGF